MSRPPEPATETAPGRGEQDAAATLEIIRGETALRYPVHSLSTGGDGRIEIRRRDEKGALVFAWEVSHNSRYGPPGHLAYKLDTLIVNRRVYEATRGGQPVPKLLRLGSLSEVAREVGTGDKNLRAVKNALYQNAFAALTVRGLRYRAADRTEQTFEFGDTRYGIVFTGERLPDGRRADGVYVVFHDLYLRLLNTAERRPLDYDYLRELPPAAQRFYEIVSYEMLPALRYGQRAKLPYSEFCLYSTMTRYAEFEQVKKQMYKIHRPHVASGYLARVEYEPAVDAEGRPDWNMFYTPGERARYQQLVFGFDGADARRRRRDEAGVGKGAAAAAGASARAAGPSPADGRQLPLPPPSVASAEAGEDAAPAAAALVAAFHEAFGRKLDGGAAGVPAGDPDLRVAAELIGTEGAERARFLVEFARREAPKTKYRPRTFRGILQYRGEAFAEWNAQQEARRKREAEAARENARKSHEDARRRAEEAEFDRTLGELGNSHPEALEAFSVYVETKRRSDVEWKRRQKMPESILAKVAADYDTAGRRRELYAEWVREYEEGARAPAEGSDAAAGAAGGTTAAGDGEGEGPSAVAASIAASLGLAPGHPDPAED